MRVAHILAILAITVAMPWAVLRAADPSVFFADGTASFENGNYAQALIDFQKAVEAGSQGPAVLYNIGVTQYRLGEYADAERTFRRMAEEYPAMRALAQYNIGLSLLKLERRAAAQTAFTRAQQQSADDKVSVLAAEALRRLELPKSRPEARSWVSVVDLSVGHDDNIVLIDDASIPSGMTNASSYAELMAVVSGPVTVTRGFRLDGSLYSVHYDSASDFDQLVVAVGGAYHWAPANWLVEAGPYSSYSTLGGDGLDERLGVRFSLKRGLTPTTTFAVRFGHEQIDDADPRYAYISGSRSALRLAIERARAEGRLSLAYELETNARDDPGVSPTRNRVSLGYLHRIGSAWATNFRISYRTSSYDDLLSARDEDLIEIDAGFVRDISRSWQLNGRYRWSDNDSTASELIYSRSRVSLGISRQF